MPPRITQALSNVLHVLAHDLPPHYPYDLATRTSVTHGAIYNLLDRLESQGLVISTPEAIDPVVAGRPARRHYTLTAAGQAHAHTVNQTRPPLLPRRS